MNNRVMPKWSPDQNARLAIAVHELAMAVRKHNSPQFAFDQLGPELKRTLRLAKDSNWLKKGKDMKPRFARDQDDDNASPVESGKRDDIDQLIRLASEMCGGDKETMDRFFRQLEASFPGSVGSMENVGEDTADLDDPPANSGGERYSGQRAAVYGEDDPPSFPGKPMPGKGPGGERIKFSSLEAKTPAQRRREAEEKARGEYAEDSYERMFGRSHIGLDNQIPMPPTRANTPSLAMDGSVDTDDYERYFPMTRRIGVL